MSRKPRVSRSVWVKLLHLMECAIIIYGALSPLLFREVTFQVCSYKVQRKCFELYRNIDRLYPRDSPPFFSPLSSRETLLAPFRRVFASGREQWLRTSSGREITLLHDEEHFVTIKIKLPILPRDDWSKNVAKTLVMTCRLIRKAWPVCCHLQF
ncbi:hypothetical protein SODALDRAFT_349368 [Sodiomyces alkalinus F11]|uniref:Uncharacterized protein n=1 Tax=Sodiomyces alkalinus (strain CBS 110278 / VKM F-3762 / F11) TaxID=1314773 RepID=A0A3N2Q3L8_SODAK|nr:hypothetical protein SODALDRAFT_349368 [Sodiomyces alkalinus F11]ROT41364.1 hypothetical protein SODALDRAFT_349368 [Sodiomyces alkalinus F11]